MVDARDASAIERAIFLPVICYSAAFHFALHFYQDCVSLIVSKRRGKIQGMTERGT
jgi:hypothetical protein